MTSQAPAAGVPSGGGNGKFIVLALLLLGGVGGLIAWRKLSPPPANSVGPIPSSAFPSHKVGEDSIPPPVAMEDSGPAVAAKPVAVAPSNGCDKKCAGSASDAIENALAQKAKQARRCYEKALANDATLKGKVSLNLKIGTNGSVCSVSVASNDIGNDYIGQCAADLFRNSSFPSPTGGCIETNLPLNFTR